MAGFPVVRPRRLRISENMRRMVRETVLTVDDLIYPMFVVPGKGIKEEIPSMPGNYHLSVDRIATEVEEVARLGIPAIVLFGIPDHKDAVGTADYDPDGVVQRAIRAIKAAVPELLVIGDVCMCEYTDHGHCGMVNGWPEGNPAYQNDKWPERYILNDETLPYLGKIAVTYAESGADLVAPSGMMDGMVGAIRSALDEAGFERVSILSYAAKYASAFYGPFRDAAQSPPRFGDRKQYQMDPANAREALREIELDIAEGADIVMVKPAMAYMDVIRLVRERFDLPLAAYSVSGEYSMIKAAAARGWIDERAVAMEVLTGIKRAGADMILTYWAKDVARWLG